MDIKTYSIESTGQYLPVFLQAAQNGVIVILLFIIIMMLRQQKKKIDGLDKKLQILIQQR